MELLRLRIAQSRYAWTADATSGRSGAATAREATPPHRAADPGGHTAGGGSRAPPELERRIRDVDVALIDGNFYDEGDAPDRDLREIPHPFVRETLLQLQGAPGTIYFTHLNHTNPLLAPDAAGRPALPHGFGVLDEGHVFAL